MARAAAAALAAVALLALPAAARGACTQAVGHDPAVPTFRSVNGFALGARPATPAESDRYLAALDAASARVTTGSLGTTAEDRPVRFAIASAPGSLARLDAVSAALRRLRRGTSSAAAARRVARSEPAVAWLGGAVHGNEPSGGDAALGVLHDLAARTDCANERRLARLVTVVVPVQNPDGRAAETRANSFAFDLNRDWFARTQPETAGKIGILRRLPPVLAVDAHEETSSSFFFPPNADPVYHETPPRALAAIEGTFGPALRRAFVRRGLSFTTGRTYDLFFQGYADTVTTTAFGAAGMTFEKGRESPFGARYAEQLVAQQAALDAAAAAKPALLERWAASWREARAEGARGTLLPNRLLSGGTPARAVPRRHVFAYAIRTDRATADAGRLVERLLAFDVSVHALTRSARVTGYRPYGARGTRTTTLPAGTLWVSAAQGAKHWVHALLADEAFLPVTYFFDVTSWSNPLLMGLAGGAVEARSRLAGLRAVKRPPAPGAPPAGAAAYAVPGDSTGGLAVVADLLAGGVAVRRATSPFTAGGARRPAGTAIVPGSAHAALAASAAARGVEVASLVAPPAATAPVAPARVAVLREGTPRGGGAASSGWLRWVLGERLGLPVRALDPLDVAAGALTTESITALVVPAGGAASPLSATTLAAIAAFVRAGGTLVGVGARGVDVARAAGVTETRRTAPPSLVVPGAAVSVDVDGGHPVGWGQGGRGFALNDSDPVLVAPAGARVAVRYPRRPWVSGYSEGIAALAGTPAVVSETAGSGRTVLFAFDPSFRGYAEWGQRLLGNAVLHPRGSGARGAASGAGGSGGGGSGGGERGGAAAGRLRPALTAGTPGGRTAIVRVRPADAGALRAAAHAARAGGTLAGSTLRVPNPTGAAAEELPWLRPLLDGLAARGVTPTLVVA